MDWLGLSPSLVLDAEQHFVVMVGQLDHWWVMSEPFHRLPWIAIALVWWLNHELVFDK